jgi:hypothetical protein
MKWQMVLSTASLMVSSFMPVHPALAQSRYEQQVLSQLDIASRVYRSQGYSPVLSDVDTLNEGQTMNYTLTLRSGRNYAILGACDEDCADLDLYLYDGNGDLISNDAETDSYPEVRVSVSRGGEFYLKVTMYGCSSEPCYYGFQVYGD